MSTDRISNLLSSLKNAAMAGRAFMEVPYFKQAEKILGVIRDKGLVENVKVFKEEGTGFKGIHVDFVKNGGAVRRLENIRLSKPGRRVYQEYKKLTKVKAGLGVLVVSTSRGIISGEEARKKKLGGELICKVFFE